MESIELGVLWRNLVSKMPLEQIDRILSQHSSPDTWEIQKMMEILKQQRELLVG